MKKVNRTEYAMFRGKYPELIPISSFSDPDGIYSFGYGRPAMDTDWGVNDDDIPYCRTEMRKKSRHDQKWEYTYYINEDK